MWSSGLSIAGVIMGAVVQLNNGGVGSTNVGVGQFLYHRARRDVVDDEQSASIDYELDEVKIARFGEKFGRMDPNGL